MVPAVGDPDLSSPDRPARRGGLVIFPAAGGLRAPRQAGERPPGPAGDVRAWLAQWRVFIVTLLIGACVVIAVALVLRAGSAGSTAPALPPPAPSANPGSGLHP
jgi:hypothetical protein